MKTQIQRSDSSGTWRVDDCATWQEAEASLLARGLKPAGEFPEVWIEDPKTYHAAQVDAVRYRLVNENAGAWITEGR